MKHFILNKANQKALAKLLLGSLIMATGINLFIAPHNLAFGGVTGITIIIHSLSGTPIYVSNVFLSIAIILVGWIKLGKEFIIKTIVPTALLPLILFLTTPLSNFAINLPVSVVMGAVTVGVGISLTMLAGGSTAGPDTVGLVLNKCFDIPITLTMLIIDVFVIACGYHVYGMETAILSISVAILMNITVKLTKDILSKKTVFRYWHKNINSEAMISKS